MNQIHVRLHARLFGRFQLVCNERSLHLSQPRLQSLLAYLLLQHPTSQMRQRLAYLLWGDTGEQQARTNLRNLLFQLRQAWPEMDHFLRAERHEISWQPGVEILVDVAQFEAALQQDNLAALQQARALYAGILLPDLFDEWVLQERERLQALFLATLHKLSSRYAEMGNLSEAIFCAEELLRHDPLREESYRQLMRLYSAVGDRAQLEQIYQRCVTTLQQELGVAPDPQTTNLYQTLLQTQVTRPTTRKTPSAEMATVQPTVSLETTQQGEATRLHNFPAPSPLMIPRPTIIAQITAQLLDANCRLLTLLGAGGMGKTSLAIATAHVIAGTRHFADGLYFVDLTPLSAPTQMLSALARALQLALHDQETPRYQILHHLAPRHALLVLDNYEHLLPDLTLVTDILTVAPNVKLLVTSREALNLRVEKRFLAPGLSHPSRTSPTPGALDGERYEAVDLFLRIATHLQPEFVVTQQARAEIERICTLVDGSPLALEMAAGWLRLFDCHEIRTQLEQSLDFLVAQTHDVATRQQSMRAVIEQSWQLLTEPEQQILAQMAVFAGSFTSEMAMSITGARVVDLSVLLDKTFLSRRVSRLRLHELLRQFAYEKLQQLATLGASPAQSVWERHAHAFLGRLAARERDLFGEQPIETIRQLEPDLDNIRAAWRWASATQQITLLASSLSSLMRLFELRWLMSEADELLVATLQQLKGALHTAGSAAETLYARLLIYQAEMRYKLEDVEVAMALAQEADSRARHSNDVSTQAQVQLLLGRIFYNRIQFDIAGAHLQQALALAKQVGEQTRLCAFAYMELSEPHRSQSDYSTALAYLQQAHTVVQGLGDREAKARVLYAIALVHWDTWQLQQTHDYLEQTIGLLRQLENPVAMIHCQFLVGALHLRRGQYDEAQRELEQALQMAEEAGLKVSTADTLHQLSRVYLNQGDSVHARQVLQRAIVLYPAVGHAERVSECLFTLADIEQKDGDFQSARDHFLQALHGFQRLSYARGILHTNGRLGCIYRLLGEYGQAQHYLDNAIHACKTHNEQSYLPFCYVERAALAQEQEDREGGRHYATEALTTLALLGKNENAISGVEAYQRAQEILAQL